MPRFPKSRVLAILWFGLCLGASRPASSGTPAEARLHNVAHLQLTGATITQVEVASTGTFALPAKTVIIPGAETSLSGLPAFCRVAATLKPTPDSKIQIEVWLPLEHWNGRFLGTGNGGGAGHISYNVLAAGLKRGYATANTDLGTSPNAEAVTDHPERWADFGSRGTHEMTEAAKAIVEAYYGEPASHAYFVGGSTGGQQALVEAQRYPEDYNGIVAGAPAGNRTHLHAMFLWNWQAWRAEPGSSLSPEKAALVARAVIKACAGKDGGAPGDDFLTDPRMCQFDPESLLPPPGKAAGKNYLTRAQVSALEKIYAGPTNPRTGERIFAPIPYGSEPSITYAWNPRIPPFPYVFDWGVGAGFDTGKFDFDRDMTRMDERLAPILNANNPDLSGLRRHGGKILMYTGTADAICPFPDTLNYYERVVRAQGGLFKTQEFFRYFLVPGMGHVSGGPGLNDFGQTLATDVPQESDHDILTALVRWVEQGVPPDRIIATAYKNHKRGSGIRFQRPIYPYPKFPHYIGGDVNSPTSYEGVDHERGRVSVPAARYLN